MPLSITLGMAKKIYKTGSGKTTYPSDGTDEEWAFCAPYLTLMKEDAPRREHPLRAVFNAVRYLVRVGCPRHLIPNDFPPTWIVYQQVQRWIAAGCFVALTHDLRKLLRMLAERSAQPSAAILDGRTLQSTPESGARAGYDGYKRKKGAKVHIAVDPLGHLLALKVTPANEQERAQVEDLMAEVQEVTGGSVSVAFVDQGYTGEEPAAQAAKHGVELIVVKLAEAKRGFVLLPRRWVVERSFAWMSRFRRLARDDERLPTSVAGLHWLAFLTLMLQSLLR
jgi:transposase